MIPTTPPNTDLDYTQDGFDPHSITVPRLRNILVEHSVPFPSTAKKLLLVQLFNTHVAPRASTLRKQAASIVISSQGIVDVVPQNRVAPDKDASANLSPNHGGENMASTNNGVDENNKHENTDAIKILPLAAAQPNQTFDGGPEVVTGLNFDDLVRHYAGLSTEEQYYEAEVLSLKMAALTAARVSGARKRGECVP